jgi:hypothetical protein
MAVLAGSSENHTHGLTGAVCSLNYGVPRPPLRGSCVFIRALVIITTSKKALYVVPRKKFTIWVILIDGHHAEKCLYKSGGLTEFSMIG